jgi:hypothetical protein
MIQPHDNSTGANLEGTNINNARDSRTSEDAPYSHAADTSIPDGELTDSNALSIKTVLLFWLLLLIACAVIGFGLQIAASDHDQSHHDFEHPEIQNVSKQNLERNLGGRVALESDCVVVYRDNKVVN